MTFSDERFLFRSTSFSISTARIFSDLASSEKDSSSQNETTSILIQRRTTSQPLSTDFVRDVRMSTKAISSPFLVQVVDSWTSETATTTEESTAYLVKNYKLASEIAPIFSVETIVRISLQLLRALDSVHSHGFFHGNISPFTIIINDDESAQLLQPNTFTFHRDTLLADWSKEESSYIAPELIHHRKADARTDLYALGACLYYITSGKHLFEGKSLEILRQALYSEPKPIQLFSHRFPDALAKFIHTLCSKHRSQRFLSAREAAEYLVQNGFIGAYELESFSSTNPLLSITCSNELLSRQDEITLLRESLSANEYRLIEIAGEHGVGKSTLLRWLATEAGLLGKDVFTYSCNENLSLTDKLLTFFGTLSYPGKFLDSLLEYSSKNSLVLLIDDSEKLDESSAQIIREILSTLQNQNIPALVVVAHRTQIAQFGKRSNVLTLSGLKQHEMAQYFKEVLGQYSISEPFLNNLLRSTAGNFYSLELLLSQVIRENLVSRSLGTWINTQESFELPQSFSALFSKQVADFQEIDTFLLQFLAAKTLKDCSTITYSDIKDFVSKHIQTSDNQLFFKICARLAERISCNFSDNSFSITNISFCETVGRSLHHETSYLLENFFQTTHQHKLQNTDYIVALVREASVMASLGKHDIVLPQLENAAALAHSSGNNELLLQITRFLAEELAILHNWEEAERVLHYALEVADIISAIEKRRELEDFLRTIRAKIAGEETTQIAFELDEVQRPANQQDKALELLASGILVGKSLAVKTLRKNIKLVSSAKVPVLIHTENDGLMPEEVVDAVVKLRFGTGFTIRLLDVRSFKPEEVSSVFFGDYLSSQLYSTQSTSGLLRNDEKAVFLFVHAEYLPIEAQTRLLREILYNPAQKDKIFLHFHGNIEQALYEGTLTRDLYDEISIAKLLLPNIEQRREDIPELISFFLAQANTEFSKSVLYPSNKFLQIMMRRTWIGGISEIRSTLRRLVFQAESDVLHHDQIPPDYRYSGKSTTFREISSQQHTDNGHNIIPDVVAPNDITTIDNLQREHILRVLEQTEGNKSEASKMLGIKRTTLIARMKKFGIMP